MILKKKGPRNPIINVCDLDLTFLYEIAVAPTVVVHSVHTLFLAS